MRILLIAEAANPEMVSVPLEGWSHAQAICKIVNAHLVTQIRNLEAIEKTGWVNGREFTAVDSEAVARILYLLRKPLGAAGGKGWTMATAMNTISYYYFERLVWKQFGPRIQAGEFSLVHRLTPLSPTTPSLMARKCRRAGVPFILGPLNGGVPWPRGFDGARRKEREWLSYVRDFYKLMPGFRSTRRNSSAILIGSRDTWQQMPKRYHEKCVYVPENAIDPSRFTVYRTRRAERPLRLLFVGRLVPYKGADMLLEAAAPLARKGDVTIEIIGDGPQTNSLRLLCAALGIESAVNLVGWVPHEKLQHHLIEADLFVFPSIREFGGAVVLEAMAVGLVPLVVRYGGPAELVTEATGFTVELGSRESIIQQLRETLQKLVANPELIDQKSEPARQRVLDFFTWEAKAKQVVEIYRQVMANSPPKP